MNSNTPTEQTSKDDIEQRLALKYDYTFIQEGKKSSLLLNMVFLGGPFALLFLFLSYTSRDASLFPLIIAACVNGLWALLIALKHHSIDISKYDSLEDIKQSSRLFYDSSWAHTYKGGFILFISVVLIWSIVEISLILNINERFAFVYIGTYLLGCIICILKRDWISKIYVEGSEKHTWLKPIISIFAFIGASFIAMSGLARLSQAIFGQETAQWIYFPFLAIGLWLLAIAGFIYSLISFKIALVQHKFWKNRLPM